MAKQAAAKQAAAKQAATNAPAAAAAPAVSTCLTKEYPSTRAPAVAQAT